MAIWSLTQERVEKLLRQIGDKESEIDALQKLSPKDIWTVDLDAFVEEWNTQLDDDKKRKKKIASITRRASKKLGIGAGKPGKGKKKRSLDDSASDSGSDFGPVRKKAKPKKDGLLNYLQQDQPVAKKPSAAEALKSSAAFGATAPQKQGTLLSHLVKKEKDVPQTDGAEESLVEIEAPAPAPKRARPAAVKKAIEIDSEDEDSDLFAAVAKEVAKKPAPTVTASRTARGAAKAAPKYNLGGSDSDSDDDDLLGDVSSMVKTIGAGTNGVPMFKAALSARPASNGSTRPGSSAAGPKASKKSSPIESDDDETNYEGLMPQPSPERPAPRNVNDTIMTSDDDDIVPMTKKPAASKLNTKAAPKAKAAAAKPVPKAKALSAVAAVKKSTQLSPAAKAYAAKLAKGKTTLAKPALKAKKAPVIDSDDEDVTMEDADALADEILSDDDDEPTPKPARAPAARPGRRAAAAKATKYVDSDDEVDSDEASEPDFDDGDSD